MYYGYELELYDVTGRNAIFIQKMYCSHDLGRAIANAESEKARLSRKSSKYLIVVRDVYMNQVVYKTET